MGLLVATMAGGVAHTLLTWPQGAPTSTVWFWMRLVVMPFLAWCVLFGLRTLYYEQENERIDAEEEVMRADRAEALQFGSDPLAVVGLTYLTGAGNQGVSQRWTQTDGLQEGPDAASEAALRPEITLSLAGDDEDPTRYRACFKDLIDAVANMVSAIPADVPFSVRLALPEGEGRQAQLDSWQACWCAKGLRTAKAALVPTETGVMALDAWLDQKGGPQLENFTLFVAVGLRDTPSSEVAEAAVALLLGWAPLAKRRRLKSIALLHRPVEEGVQTPESAMTTSLQWGCTTPDKVEDVWQVGLDAIDKTAIADRLGNLSFGVSQTPGLSGVHDLDSELGRQGVAGGWLALALGIEHAAQAKRPQWVAWREGTLRFAIIQSIA
ncbi:hypothetical protein [Ralstonia sp. 1138]|uniref:hypothetical protein n=1 Tax=Ralstonia sp. 1138 TaxID=3156423 RepID=UPI00339A9902